MNFDFNWFLSIPGLLITGGVLLLVIALIIFLATSKKKDKPVKAKKGEINAAVPSDMITAQQPATDIPVQPLEEVMSTGVAQPANTLMGDLPPLVGQAPTPTVEANPIPIPDTTKPQLQPTGTGNPEGIVPNVQPVTEPIAPTVNLQNEPVQPVVATPAPQVVEPVVQAPVIEPAPVPTPEVAVPTPEPIVEAPVVAPEIPTPQVQPAPSVIPQVEVPKPVENNNVSIYGGASPVVPDLNLQQNETHQIYGGANPLENTQTMNVVQPVQPTPVISAEPVAIPQNPVPGPMPEQPIVQPQAVGAPNPAPVGQPAQNGIPVQSVEATAPSTNVEVLNI